MWDEVKHVERRLCKQNNVTDNVLFWSVSVGEPYVDENMVLM